jgi:uncharacterized protein
LRNKLAPIIVDATPRRSTSSLGSALGPVGRIGIISDTHGLLRPEAATFLRGCNHILHGGDKGAWAETLPETELFEFSGIHVYVIHDLSQLDIDPSAAGIRAVISGHSHKPRIEQRDGVFFINPGSAGPRRFKLPVSVAELLVDGNTVSSRIVELDIHGAT